jgi:chromate transporter
MVPQPKEPPGTVSGTSRSIGLWEIGSTFLNIGIVSFSLSALGETKKWVTTERGWFTDEEYLQGVGLAQLLPGAPTINLTSYLGYRLRGIPGAATATVSFLTPCFVLMAVFSHIYFKYGNLPLFSDLFKGLGALVLGLVFNTLFNLWVSGIKSLLNWIMALLGFLSVFWLKLGIVKILFAAGTINTVVALLTIRYDRLSMVTRPLSEVLKKRAPVLSSDRETGEGIVSGKFGNNFSTPYSVSRTLFWLAMILAADIALIARNPQVMEMGVGFLKIGSLVFGSGYAMLPFIQDVVVNKHSWLTNSQFSVGLALSLVTPGPVTIIGAFIGYKVFGVVGALAGIVNMYYPAWAMTAIVSNAYAKAGRVGVIKHIISGIVAAFIGTLVVVLIRLSSSTLTDPRSVALALSAFTVQRFTRVNTVWIILCGALVSLILFH